MRRGIVLCLWVFLSHIVHAECVAPTGPSDIPSGASATAAEMADVRRQLQAFDSATGSYLQCLNGELTQHVIGHTDEERQAARRETTKAYSVVWIRLKWMTACYNAEQRTFRETGGGQKAVPADCSTYVAEATAAAAAPATASAPKSDADSADFSEPRTLPTGSWRYRVVRGTQNVACRFQAAADCVESAIEVENASRTPLECQVQVDLEGVNNEGQKQVITRGVIASGSRRKPLKTLLPPGATVKSSAADCRARELLPPLTKPKDCKFEVVRAVDVSTYYPPASRRLAEEGFVALQFTLKAAEGHPANIRVVGSSLFPRLDAAASKAVGDMVLKTPCPGNDFRMQLNFELD